MVTKKKKIIVTFLFIFLWWAVEIRSSELRFIPLWEKDTGFTIPNEPVIDDLNYDGIPELILTDIMGKIAVYNATSGETLWSETLKGNKLTGATVGNFLGLFRRNIAIGGSDGFVYIFDGLTGKLLLKIDVGTPVVYPPTPVPLSSPVSGEIQEGLSVIDIYGRVKFYEISGGANSKANERWSIWTAARITAPASVGFVTSETFPDVVIGTTFGEIWVINIMYREGKTPLKFTNIQRRPTYKMVVPLDIAGDKRQELVFCDNAGNLNALQYQDARLSFLFSEVPIYGPPFAEPLGVDLNQDGKKEVVVSSPQSLNCFLGSLGERCWQKPYQTLACIISGPTLFLTRDNKQIILLLDERGTASFINAQNGSEFGTFKLRNNQLLYFLRLVDVQGDGLLDLLGIDSSRRRLVAYSTNLAIEPSRFFWLSTGGNPYGTNSLDGFFWEQRAKLFQLAKTHLQEQIKLAELAIERQSWQQSFSAARNAFEVNPLHPRARQLYRYAWVRANIILISSAIILLLALLVLSGRVLMRFFRKRAFLRRALGLINLNKSDEAIRLLQYLLRAEPNNKQVATLLAGELIKIGNFSPDNIPIFELAHGASKDDLNILKALAMAYNNAQRQDEKALATYLEVYDYLEEPAPFAYTIACIYQRKGDLEKAAKFLREAIRGGLESDEVLERLTQIYLQLNYSEPRAIKVYERMYPKYKDNPEFLKALARAYQLAKRTDIRAREVYEKTLEREPKFLPALIQLAQIKIEENKLDEAENFAEAALKIDHDNGAGLLLLSQCYLLRDRQDKTAIKVFQQTLRHYPDNKEILRVLAQKYWQSKRLDEEAKNIYHRAYKYHPYDQTILFAMAKIEEKVEQPELVVEIGERLLERGLALPEHYLWLAEAYQKLRITEPKATEVYQRALSITPNNFNILVLLGECFINQDRKDQDAIAVYEKILRHDPKQINFGKQLARAYIHNQLYEKCLQLTTEMLKTFSGEKGFLHLRAQASLLNNQIDEAIREYQRILGENPGDELAILNLALAYSQKARTDEEARAQYERALTIQPENQELRRMMARVFSERQDFLRAVIELRLARSQNPRLQQKIVQDCRDILSKATDPAVTHIRWFLLELLMDEGRLREAIEVLDIIFQQEPEKIPEILKAYEQILAKDPNNSLAHLRAGQILKIKGEFELARKEMEKAYELQPQEPDIQEELAELYELILSEPDLSSDQAAHNEVRFQLGKLYYVMGDYDRAIGCFQKAARDFRWESDALKMLGRSFMAKGMLDLALQEFRKLVVDNELKELLYDLAQRYERKQDLVGAKTVYRHLFAADIDYKDVRQKFEMFAGSTSDPLVFEKTTILNTLGERAKLRYELLEEIGRGAMGIIYKARDNELDEIVALKILPDQLSNNPEALNRFKQEARSARRLTHPGIVRIHDIGEEMGRKYISMEFVEGIDLKRLLKRERRLPWQKAVRYGWQIVDALAYAHSMGVIHRDIKSANIMITLSDNVKITDFGIAKVMESTEVTLAGSVIGTPLYMAPEQIQGGGVDARADLYSLGIMLYEIIRGRPPFVEGDLQYQHLHREPEPIGGIPSDLTEIITRCLRKRKEERFRDALELRAHLEKIAVNFKVQVTRQ